MKNDNKKLMYNPKFCWKTLKCNGIGNGHQETGQFDSDILLFLNVTIKEIIERKKA